MSEPPNSVIGSNVPSDLVLPKRVSTRPVVPPTAVPGPKWQVWHEASLKTGPSPSSTASTAANSSLPAVNSARWSAGRVRNGSANHAPLPPRGPFVYPRPSGGPHHGAGIVGGVCGPPRLGSVVGVIGGLQRPSPGLARSPPPPAVTAHSRPTRSASGQRTVRTVAWGPQTPARARWNAASGVRPSARSSAHTADHVST